MTAGERSILLDHLRYLDNEERGLLANARCLGEGIDVPTLDGVAFVDPRRSEVDIVQAVGRSIRLAEGKKVGTIVIPVFIEVGADPDAALDASAFKPVWDVIRSLRAHDDELGEQLDELRRELGRGKKRLGIPPKIHLDLPTRVGSDFVDAFDVHLVNQTTESWEFWFGLLQRFVAREGHTFVPQSHVEDRYQLGRWVQMQRISRQLGADRVNRLEALPGWTWDPSADKWEEGFRHLQRFVQTNGHSLVSRSYEQGGYRLGQWVMVQRAFHARGQLGADRVTRLEALPGWSWNTRADKWEEGFRHLQRFIAREGHTLVPQAHVEDGHKLGRWVQKQRADYATERLALDRVTGLEALPGWIWDPLADNWDGAFHLLCRYNNREGHSLVPQSYVEDGLQLGHWVMVQRAFYARRQLGADRVTRLAALPGWTWDPSADRWDEAFDLLCRYNKREGHSRVPQAHVEDGHKLGRWVQKQRADYATERLALDRAARLEAVPGWRWVTRKGRRTTSNSKSHSRRPASDTL